MPKYTHIRQVAGGKEKRCSKCRKWLPAAFAFYNRLWRGPLGFQPSCRKCQRKALKAHYDTPAGKSAVKRYRKANWEAYLAYHRRWRNQPDVKKRRAAKAYIDNRTPKRRAYQAAWQRAKRARLRAAAKR